MHRAWFAGMAHYLASLYWLLLIPVPWTWAWAKALGWVALAAYLALYPATWVWLLVLEDCFRSEVGGDRSTGDSRKRVEESTIGSGCRGRGGWCGQFLQRGGVVGGAGDVDGEISGRISVEPAGGIASTGFCR